MYEKRLWNVDERAEGATSNMYSNNTQSISNMRSIVLVVIVWLFVFNYYCIVISQG